MNNHFSKSIVCFALLFVLNWQQKAMAQLQHCDELTLQVNGVSNIDLVFDSFTKYLSGITQNGASNIRVSVKNNITNDPECRWNLVMMVDNNSAPGLGDWELIQPYTSSGDLPSINIISVRIRNQCNTSRFASSAFTDLNLVPGDVIYIIENIAPTVEAGSCLQNVNGPGTFLTNYDEFSFMVDYKIVPGLNLRSGIYQLLVRYILAEDI